MTREEVLALPVALDLLTTAKALGIGRSMAYQLARAGTFPVRVQRFGHKYQILRSDLLDYLGISDAATPNGAPSVIPLRGDR